MYNTIIRNGVVIDGLGKPMYPADIAIKGQIISRIGKLAGERGEVEIDASGHFICPGFIDVNNHSDEFWQIFSNPHLESLIYQGVATIIGGNCGSSLAPLLSPEAINTIQKWANINRVTFNWLTVKEFLSVLENNRLSVNFGTLVGHGTLRRGILGDQMRKPNEKEMRLLEKALKKAMKEGALGLSAGLVYTHARSADQEELIRFAKIVKKYQGVFVIHLRDEKDKILESLSEAIEVGKKSGVKLHISHLKAVGEGNWPLMDRALFMISKANEEGVDITFDAYPYTNTGSVMYTYLPDWISEGGRRMMLSRLRQAEIREKLIKEMRASGFPYSKIEIASSPLNKNLNSRKISDIAREHEKSVEEAVLDVLVASEGRVITSCETLKEENVINALKHPLSILSSNGAGYNLDYSKTGELVHPRSFGAFAKWLSYYVIDKGILSWEEAIKKVSSQPAERFGLKRRGKIKEKYIADLAIINPDTIHDRASKENPYRYADGVEALIINGRIILKDGRYLYDKEGEIIRR